LTGVYNRRAINAALDEAKHRADTIDEPLSLCINDLNPRVSTTTGIWRRRSVEGVQHSVRAGCVPPMCGRYGGEEFIRCAIPICPAP
jgi:GGDEF domain-containing protein